MSNVSYKFSFRKTKVLTNLIPKGLKCLFNRRMIDSLRCGGNDTLMHVVQLLDIVSRLVCIGSRTF